MRTGCLGPLWCLAGVKTFEHEPEGKEERMMEILFMKKGLKVFANAVIEE